jgi:hypothetical protein
MNFIVSTNILYYLQAFYIQIFNVLKIHLCFTYALLMSGDSLQIIKIDRNLFELRQIVCKKNNLTLVHLLVLTCELFTNARTWITSRSAYRLAVVWRSNPTARCSSFHSTFLCSCQFFLPMIYTIQDLKVKVNFALEQATKTQRGSRCIALLFL